MCKNSQQISSQVYVSFGGRVMAKEIKSVLTVKMSDPDHQWNLINWALASGLSVQQIHPKSLLKYLIYSTARLTGKKLIKKGGKLTVREAIGSIWGYNVNWTVSRSTDVSLRFGFWFSSHILYTSYQGWDYMTQYVPKYSKSHRKQLNLCLIQEIWGMCFDKN